MSDIWGNIGVDIAASEGEWLYRVGGEVRGPLPKKEIVEKLLRGEVSLDTPVAREGGEFHPLGRVAAFSEHIAEAQKLLARKARAKRAKALSVLALLLLVAGGVGGMAVYQDFLRREAAQKAAADKERKAREAREAALDAVPEMKLVALVSLGTEEDVKIKSTPKKTGKGRKASAAAAKAGGKAKEAEAEESFVSQCMLSQGDIFGTLRKHLGKLNVCVEDEKGRDTQGLLPETLTLEFVVQPSGSVVDFSIDNRHFRRGPLNNCMIKAFRTIQFPTSKGANCPVTIPIKIGK